MSVTEFDGALGDPAGADGTLDASHRYREPGIYQATVCIVDDDEPHNPVCDTFVVTVVNSFLKFAGFANAYKAEADRDAVIGGSFGGNETVRVDSDVTVTGDVVSVYGDVDMKYRTTVGGRVVAGHDVDIDKNSAVAGTVDADRYVEVDETSTTGPITIGPVAYDFPEVRWVDLDFVGGTNDLKTTGRTQLPAATYGDVEVSKGTLVLGPGVYRFESLETKKDTRIQLDLDAGETIVIEVAGDVDFNKDTSLEIAGTAGPSDVLVLVGDGKVALGDGGSYVGTFISDDRLARLGKGATLVGALYGRSVKFEDDTRVTADPAKQLFADHLLVLEAVDTVLITVDAGLDQFVFEDTLIDLDPALFWNRDEPMDHSATIDWGDGTTPDLVAVTPIDLAYNDPDGTIQGSHVYVEPGEYVVSVCVFSATEPACQLDTFVVTVVPGFTRFATFADYNHTHIAKNATVIGSAGANGRVDLGDDASVSGSVVSVYSDVDLHGGATVGGNVIAGRDADIHDDAVVSGDLDAGRKAKIDGTVGGVSTIGETATVFPAVRWIDIDFAGGEVDRKTTGTTSLAPDIYGDVRVDAGTLILDGGVYRFRSLKADPGTVIELHLNAGETIVLQVEREVDLGRHVRMRIVGSASPDDVLVLVSDAKIGLGVGGTFVGTFISDDAEARLGKDATLAGALYGTRIRIDEGAILTFDPASGLLASQYLPNQFDTRYARGSKNRYGPQAV